MWSACALTAHTGGHPRARSRGSATERGLLGDRIVGTCGDADVAAGDLAVRAGAAKERTRDVASASPARIGQGSIDRAPPLV
jgi:hypothetical protein